MSDPYAYLDPDHTYTDPETGLLRNLQGITDPDVLRFVESVAVTKRLQELYLKPVKIIGIESLFDIHKHLFQDIYAWAGYQRVVEISKEGKQFFPTSHFHHAFRYIDRLIAEAREIENENKKAIAEKLAEILDNVNYLHPFREGNGRAQREFIRMLAAERGLSLHLNPPDDKSIYERYMKGTVESDVTTLAGLIFELMNAKKT